MFHNYVIEIWDTSPQLGDMRNPSVLILKMEVYCEVEAIKDVHASIKALYSGSNIEFNSWEKVVSSKPITI